jgi:alkyl hydroperoxide reductase subunit AhpF
MKLAEYLKVEGQRVTVVERGPQQRSSFWPKLLSLAPWINLEFQRDPELGTRHTQLIGSRKHGSIRFLGDIADQQILSLLETLRGLASGKPQWSAEDTAARVGALERAVDLDVYVSPMCPFCVTLGCAALRFAAVSPDVSVRILRADVCGLPEQVHTLPTVLADGEIVAQGAASEESLIRQIAVYQSAVAPVSGIGVRSARPTSQVPPANPRHRRSTAA